MSDNLTTEQKNAIQNAYWSLFDGYDSSLELNGVDNVVTQEIKDSLQQLHVVFPWIDPSFSPPRGLI